MYSNVLGSEVPNLAGDALLASQLQPEDDFGPARQREVPDSLIEDPEYQSTYNKYDKRKRRAGADNPDTHESLSETESGSEFEDETLSSSDQDSDSSSDWDLTGKNDSTNREKMSDESDEIVLHSRTQRQMRETFSKLNRKE